MPEQPPRPDKAFAESAQGAIQEFCEQNYAEENQEACVAMVTDKLVSDPPQQQEPSSPPEGQAPPSGEPPAESEPEPQSGGFETLVADCAGNSGFLGIGGGPDQQACLEAVARFERERHQ